MFKFLKKLFCEEKKDVGFDYLWLIKKHEKCKLNAYLCPAGVPTIGWGTTYYMNHRRVKLGEKITQEEADNLLMWYCSHIVLPKGQFGVNQKVALYSVIYNVGQDGFDNSKCRKAIEKQDWKTAFKEWNWVKSKGKILKGLVKRRKEERALFFDGLVNVEELEKKYFEGLI